MPRPRHIHGPLASAIMICLVLVPVTRAWATSPPALVAGDAADMKDDAGYRDRFWLVDPRTRPSVPQPNLMKFEVHGEYRVRYTRVPDLALSDYGFSDYRGSLGQTQRLEHLLRLSPRFSYRESLAVVAQFDVPHGMLLGQTTDHVANDPEPMTDAQPMRFSFRWLYADIRFKTGQLKVGQQPARWGAGLVFDSGDERQFFGDARLGTIVERIAFQGKPFGPHTKFELLLATDWVYSDARTRWLDGDRALRTMVGLSYVDSPQRRVGLLVVGEKSQLKFTNSELRAMRPTETTSTFDLAGETSFPVPGQPAHIIASGEAAMVVGTTDVAPEVLAQTNARVQRLGALARVGAVGTRGVGNRRWGKWGLMLEWGYASSDSNPGDGVDRRFVGNPARRIGLILFDEVLRWKSARAAATLEDPRIGMRPTSSATAIPTAGGVSGATYCSLQWLYRPLPNFDLRAAALVAQASGDIVDPARLVTTGRWANFDGGNPAHRDLGLELDFATEFRQPLENGLGVTIGAEGGVLFPGRALANADGHDIGTQGLARGRFGFYF